MPHENSEIVVEELESVQAIYHEAEINVADKTGTIQIPINLLDPLKIVLTKTGTTTKENIRLNVVREANITALPSLKFDFKLPPGYPYNEQPIISLSTTDDWLNPFQLDILKNRLLDQWEDFHDMILFSLIDYLKVESESAFQFISLIEPYTTDNVQVFNSFVNAHQLAIKDRFNSQTFTCEICQDDKKGIITKKFDRCGHTFCDNCLVEYFASNITRGEIENIHCPSYDCTKLFVKRTETLAKGITDPSQDLLEFETQFFDKPVPSDFLLTFLAPNLVERFDTLFMSLQYERYKRLFPFRVAECPRKNCKRYFIRKDENELLTICPHCKLAFCFSCLHSWHGTQNSCKANASRTIPVSDIEKWMDAEDGSQKRRELAFKYGKKTMILAVDEYLADKMFEELILSENSGIVRCPSCQLTIQKSDGCNKMICSQCMTYFCNLCGDVLQRVDPYEHYNNPQNECFRRLFEGILSEGNVHDG